MNETFISATAVARSNKGEVVLATKEGVYIKAGERWTCSLEYFGKRIRDFSCQGEVILGIGDGGSFIKSQDGGKSWVVKRFPTQATGWSICSDSKGTVVTHGDKVIYISTDYGDTWRFVYPFQFDDAPSIRSLCLYKDRVYIGTKIHRSHGGVWCYECNSGNLTRIKAEDSKMIASMLTYRGFLVTASGSCSHNNGSIEFCSLDKAKAGGHKWVTCCGDIQPQSYLDLSEDNGEIYATSTQNSEGYGMVAHVCLEMKEISPCNFIKGHAWRITGDAQNYFVAGLYESLQYSNTVLH
ncbi:MAG: repeat domain protein [Paenibacillaceae bacterium]|jgi:hypothetical protein|nr:repeat domain protein [Paenibacillaceae bacterium]